jgi:hypothetical protein
VPKKRKYWIIVPTNQLEMCEKLPKAFAPQAKLRLARNQSLAQKTDQVI